MRTSEMAFPALLQDFFQRRLLTERGASAHTIASYRDTFQLLFHFAEQRTGRTPSTPLRVTATLFSFCSTSPSSVPDELLPR